MQACQRQIAEFRGAAMLPWRDVIDVKTQWKTTRRKMAILANAAGSLVNLLDKRRVQEPAGRVKFELLKACRALDCITANKFPICR